MFTVMGGVNRYLAKENDQEIINFEYKASP